MYTHQKMQVNWSDHIGNMFSVYNGGKQGGDLSIILFSIYLDGLLTKLNKKGVGCHMGNYFVESLAYTDDLTLIAPSQKAIQIMISICECYVADYDVILNGPNSQFLIFKSKECHAAKCQIVVNNERLNNITSAVHLDIV